MGYPNCASDQGSEPRIVTTAGVYRKRIRDQGRGSHRANRARRVAVFCHLPLLHAAPGCDACRVLGFGFAPL